MTISAYPLTWPHGFPRTKTREKGKFSTTLAGALKNVEDSLRRQIEQGRRPSPKQIEALDNAWERATARG